MPTKQLTPQTPDWVKHAVFYQIFPDRFARSRRTSHPRGIRLKPWGSPPEEQGYQGGDLRGIVDRLDYLQQLGVTALYLNPIFASASNHRYHTYDYYRVDPLLGGNAALRELLDEAHARGIRVVLDGVFNHTGRGFWQFHHILENGGNSPYIDWFNVHDWPLRPYVHDEEHPYNYEGWAGLAALPKLNTDNPGVRDLIMDVAQHWLNFGIDGWRLDVPNEIDDDSFWQEFREVVKQANPDAYIVGEIWDEAERWLAGDQFDAVMNYRFTVPVLNFCGATTLRTDYEKAHYDLQPFDAADFARAIDEMHGLYDWQINHAQLNLLDSHDTARALWIMGEDKQALRLAVLCQMTMPGAPCIYYGDEIGMSAADDPYCRAAFPWDDEGAWDAALLDFYRQAIRLRQNHPVLRTGDFQAVYAKGALCAFQRRLNGDDALVVFNQGESVETISMVLPDERARTYRQAWPVDHAAKAHAHGGRLRLTLPAREAVVLVSE